MKPDYDFVYGEDWRVAPLAFWVHVPTSGIPHEYEPPAPNEIQHKGFLLLKVRFKRHELLFSTPAQLDHFIDVLSRTPLPTSRRLLSVRGPSVGPNSHWLSRLPSSIKSPRERAKLVGMMKAIRNDLFGSLPTSTHRPTPAEWPQWASLEA